MAHVKYAMILYRHFENGRATVKLQRFPLLAPSELLCDHRATIRRAEMISSFGLAAARVQCKIGDSLRVKLRCTRIQTGDEMSALKLVQCISRIHSPLSFILSTSARPPLRVLRLRKWDEWMWWRAQWMNNNQSERTEEPSVTYIIIILVNKRNERKLAKITFNAPCSAILIMMLRYRKGENERDRLRMNERQQKYPLRW